MMLWAFHYLVTSYMIRHKTSISYWILQVCLVEDLKNKKFLGMAGNTSLSLTHIKINEE